MDQMQFMGGTRAGARTRGIAEPGGVAWARPLIASGALDHARGTSRTPAPAAVPVTDGTRVFVGAMGLCAFDLNSRAILESDVGRKSTASTTGFVGFEQRSARARGKMIMRAQSLNSARVVSMRRAARRSGAAMRRASCASWSGFPIPSPRTE